MISTVFGSLIMMGSGGYIAPEHAHQGKLSLMYIFQAEEKLPGILRHYGFIKKDNIAAEKVAKKQEIV